MQLFYEYMLPEKYTNKTREDADCAVSVTIRNILLLIHNLMTFTAT